MNAVELERAGRDLDQHRASLRQLLDRRFGRLPPAERHAPETEFMDLMRSPVARVGPGMIFGALMRGWLPTSLWNPAEHSATENRRRDEINVALNAALAIAMKPSPKRPLPLPPVRPLTTAQVCASLGVNDAAPYAHMTAQQADRRHPAGAGDRR
jgi:hypothetical protein